MRINIELRNLEDVLRAFRQAPGIAMQNYILAMRASTSAVRTEARATHHFRSRSGRLENSLKESIKTDTAGGIVGVVELPENDPVYGAFVHDGTRAHVIRPRNKRMLRWASGNGFIFARKVNHPGTAPDPFLYNAADAKKEAINAIFDRYTERMIREAGL